MRANPISREAQYKLIMECRSSGLSDCQWCIEHGIKPGTFYNWVKRLRKTGCADLPAPAGRSSYNSPKQEVVKLERQLKPEVVQAPEAVIPEPVIAKTEAVPSIELLLSGVAVRIRNDADPELLEKTLYCLRRLQC